MTTLVQLNLPTFQQLAKTQQAAFPKACETLCPGRHIAGQQLLNDQVLEGINSSGVLTTWNLNRKHG